MVPLRSIGPILMVLSACAPAAVQAPPPAAGPAGPSCRCWDCWMQVSLPPGWSPNSLTDCEAPMFHHGSALVIIARFAYPDDGSPLIRAASYEAALKERGYAIFDAVEPQAAARPAGFRYGGTLGDGQRVKGRVAARLTAETSGTGVLMIGMWSAEADAEAAADFEAIYASIKSASGGQ